LEFHNFYASPNIIKVIKSRRMSGACSTHGGDKRVYKILVGKPEGKRPLRILRHRWKDNIQMDVRKEGGKLLLGFMWLGTGIGEGLL
jgi:hypothetical protein